MTISCKKAPRAPGRAKYRPGGGSSSGRAAAHLTRRARVGLVSLTASPTRGAGVPIRQEVVHVVSFHQRLAPPHAVSRAKSPHSRRRGGRGRAARDGRPRARRSASLRGRQSDRDREEGAQDSQEGEQEVQQGAAAGDERTR